LSGCTCNDKSQEQQPIETAPSPDFPFDKEKWSIKEGHSYPFRERMLNNVIFNDSLRQLKRVDLIDLLGTPSRVNNEYLYYLIEENKLLVMTLNTRTLVIKFKEDDTVEWMKVHE
jgi:hypothetical protein